MLFVIDAVKELFAVKEARRMGMRVIAPMGTIGGPKFSWITQSLGIDDGYPSINSICKEMADAIFEGQIQRAEEEGERGRECPQADCRVGN